MIQNSFWINQENERGPKKSGLWPPGFLLLVGLEVFLFGFIEDKGFVFVVKKRDNQQKKTKGNKYNGFCDRSQMSYVIKEKF